MKRMIFKKNDGTQNIWDWSTGRMVLLENREGHIRIIDFGKFDDTKEDFNGFIVAHTPIMFKNP